MIISYRSTTFSAGISRTPSLSATASSEFLPIPQNSRSIIRSPSGYCYFWPNHFRARGRSYYARLAKFFVVLDEWSTIPADVPAVHRRVPQSHDYFRFPDKP